MYHRKRLALTLVFFVALLALQAQDVVYTQYYGNPVYLNPALAGNKICPRLTFNYRNQWPAVNKGYVSYSASYDQFFKKISGSIAVQANADVQGGGILNRMSANFVYNYKLEISKKWIGNAALQVGYNSLYLDPAKLVFADQIVPGTGEILPVSSETPPDHTTIGDVDFSSGFALGYDTKYYFGAAFHHITTPDQSFYSSNLNPLKMRITLHAGGIFDINKANEYSEKGSVAISPNLLYIKQGEFEQLNTGVYGIVYPFVAGVWYRYCFGNPDAVIALLGIEYSVFKLGYSFDYTISDLSIRSGGAHEISLVYILPCPEKHFRYRAIKCPSF